MKKLKNIFCLFVMVALFATPFSASALTYDFIGDTSNQCKTPDADGYCESTAYVVMKLDSETETPANFTGAITLKDSNAASGIKDVSITSPDSSKFTVQSSGDITSSTGARVIVTIQQGSLSTTENTRIIKVTYKHAQSLAAQNIDCGLVFSDGKVTVETKPVENVKTGASLPYAILGVAAVGALAVYVVTNKKTKLHNI